MTDAVTSMSQALEATPRRGLWLDTSDQTADEVVECILADHMRSSLSRRRNLDVAAPGPSRTIQVSGSDGQLRLGSSPSHLEVDPRLRALDRILEEYSRHAARVEVTPRARSHRPLRMAAVAHSSPPLLPRMRCRLEVRFGCGERGASLSHQCDWALGSSSSRDSNPTTGAAFVMPSPCRSERVLTDHDGARPSANSQPCCKGGGVGRAGQPRDALVEWTGHVRDLASLGNHED